ncbi:MAG: hypothetical protein K8I27_05655 [Planctomycetes bacterium]|nr:hypothetical protein [Planctomycetota bacterium]
MSGQPVNFQPYGDGFAAHRAAASGLGSMEEQALARAGAKLDSVRTGLGGDRAAGPDLVQVIPAALLALLFGAPCLIGAAALARQPDGIVGGVILGILGLTILAIPVLLWIQSKPATPKRALQGFYRSLARNRVGRARALTVQADLDRFPRHQPMIAKLGRPAGIPRGFGDRHAFQSYWNELLRSHPSPYCISRVSNVRVTPIGPDIVLVDFQLKLVMNTSLWLLLVFVALLLAVIADIATRKTVKVQMRKLLVKVDDEWHLLSAEWQGYEEFNIAWLQR